MISVKESIYLEKMRYGRHYEFLTQVSNEVFKMQSLDERLKQVYGVFSKALEEEDRCIRLIKKSAYTDEIYEQDDMRCRFYTYIKKGAEVWSKSTVAAKKEAGQRALSSIKLYSIKTKDNLEQKSGVMTNLLQDLKEADMATLHLTAAYEEIVKANTKVRQLMAERYTEWSKIKEPKALQLARKASDTAYREMTATVNAIARLDTEGKLDEGIATWNTHIDSTMLSLNYKRNEPEPEEPETEA